MKLKYWFLSYVILFLFGCNSNKTVSLNPVDSLGWQEQDEYYLQGIVEINADLNNIYLLDASQYCVLVYDRKSLESTGKIGSEGNGPGELTSALSFTLSNDSIYINDIAQRKLVVFTKDLEYVHDYKLDRFLVEIDSYKNNLYGLTHMRFPEVNLVKINGETLDTLDTYKNFQNAIGFNPDEMNAIEYLSDFKNQKVYLAHTQMQTCSILEKGQHRLVNCQYPDWIDISSKSIRSIDATVNGFLITGYYLNEAKDDSYSFALEFTDTGELLRDYKLIAPMQSGINCACLIDNELYVSTYWQIVYKYVLE